MSLDIDTAVKLLKHFRETETFCAAAQSSLVRSGQSSSAAYDDVFRVRKGNAYTEGYLQASIGKAIQDAGGIAGAW